MILDQQNTFFDAKALSAATLTSDVVYAGPGDAADQLTLVQKVVDGSSGGTISTVLETSDTEAFSTATTLATYTTADVKAKLPYGCKSYLRLRSTSTYTAGTVTASLVMDADNQ